LLHSLRGVRFAYNSPQTPHWWVKGGFVGAVGWVDNRIRLQER